MAEKRLTKEIAEQFMAYDSPYVGKFTELDDVAAEILGKYEGELDFSGLTSLSDAAAKSLRRHKGRLSLDLDALPESAAVILRPSVF